MSSPIEVPRYSYKQLRTRADNFLRTHHPKATIPIPIEEIAEFRFKMNIVPIPGLHLAFEIDGFISSDLSTISVDEFVYDSRPGRYRFTLAHELGHAVLHRRIYQAARFGRIKEWMRFVTEIGIKEYEWLEWQAYAFAGLILVPPAPLKKKLSEATHRAHRAGFSISKEPEVAGMYIASWIAKQFNVSSQVIEKRLVRDELWSKEKSNRSRT